MRIIYNKGNTRVAVSAGSIPQAPVSQMERDGELLDVHAYNDEVWRLALQNKVKMEPPIYRRYSFKSAYPAPMAHQRKVSAAMIFYKKLFNLSDMGTGKTLTALWAFDYLRITGQASRLLVIAPNSVTTVWESEIRRHMPHLSYVNLSGATKASWEKGLRVFQKRHVIILNHDAMRTDRLKFLCKTGALRPDVIVVDEGGMFRNANTAKWRGLRAITRTPQYLWWLTATPTPNNPTDAWAQAAIMGTCVDLRFSEFRDITMKKANNGQYYPRPGAEARVSQILKPSIRFSIDQCVDLPLRTFQTREINMTKVQKSAYDQLRKEAVLTLKSGAMITAVNEGVMLNKLLQISCGVVYTSEGEEAALEATHKLAEVTDILEETRSPIILYAPFKSVVRALHGHFSPHHRTAVVTGGTPLSERGDIFRAFQEGRIRLLIAHPATTSHGLTLTRSSCIVWYGPVHSNDIYEQANGRIYRTGQDKPTTIINLSSSAVERRVYERLEQRRSVQKGILELLTSEK